MKNILEETTLCKLLALDVSKITEADRKAKKLGAIEQNF
jgi:hypothetical protein